MEVVDTIAAIRERRAALQHMEGTVGVVLTMGALHAGHLALITAARTENRFVLATIFVNPLQFGPHEDFTRYPRPFDRDAALLAEAGVDLLFHPSAQELYPPGFATTVTVAGITERLEGAMRPGHFAGVTTVVAKLFAITQPDRAYFGQKDAQQVAVLRRLVTDLNLPIAMCIVPTVREPDGLALSSRNAFLSAAERAAAPALYRGLMAAREQWRAGESDPEVLHAIAQKTIARARLLRLEYFEVVGAETMQPLKAPLPPTGGLLVAAAYCGVTRLIDNLPL